jgi:hypothetical protein
MQLWFKSKDKKNYLIELSIISKNLLILLQKWLKFFENILELKIKKKINIINLLLHGN